MSDAYTEAERGLKNIQTRAEHDVGEWIINGMKQVEGTDVGDYVTILCKTDEDAKPANGQSILLVETNREGIDVKQDPEHVKPPAIELSLNNVRVPKGNLIGKENDGFRQVMFFQDIRKIELAARALGTSQGAFERSLKFIEEREELGRLTWKYQGESYKLAEIASELEAMRLLTYKVAWKADQGVFDSKLISLARWKAGQVATMAVDEAARTHEGFGYIDDYCVERFRNNAEITHRSPKLGSMRNIKISDIFYKGTKKVEDFIVGKKAD